MTAAEAAGWFLLQSLAMFAGCQIAGQALVRIFRRSPVTPPPDPVALRQIALAACCVLLNAVVTLAGWALWRRGIIVVRRDAGARAWLDALVLLVAMDALMYLLHRAAHHPLLYPLVHRAHHERRHPRPLDLFVLHPAEVAGFGALWLVVLCVYPGSWRGIVSFLTLNAVFGTVGHLGVEPLPRAWAHVPILKHLGTSTFHAEHHMDGRFNFGFYTDVWDRILRTLDPRYASMFGVRHDE
jgi:sterol desaturase/sphingolipid hydroxylase (fatty acid hydroxylase superfamily)